MSEETIRDLVILLKEWIYPQLTRTNKKLDYILEEMKSAKGHVNPSGQGNKRSSTVPEQGYQSEEEKKRKEEEEKKRREGGEQHQPGQKPGDPYKPGQNPPTR